MKKLKVLLMSMALVAASVVLPSQNAISASAEGAKTYVVKYVDSFSDWRFQEGNTWNSGSDGRETYYLNQGIKDGDIVVVEDLDHVNAYHPDLKLPAKLSNLTVNGAAATTIYTNGVEDCYVVKGSSVSINGDVTNAYVYDNAIATFTGNVGTLTASSEITYNASVTIGGTLGKFVGNDTVEFFKTTTLYNFAAGKFVLTTGNIKTDKAYYSTTPDGTAESGALPTTPQNQNPASDSEYDDVPKTGEDNMVIYLFGLSVLFLAAGYGVRFSCRQ